MNREREELYSHMSGRAIAELEIEARRDAHENHFSMSECPYDRGSYARLVYTQECQRHWVRAAKEAVNG